MSMDQWLKELLGRPEDGLAFRAEGGELLFHTDHQRFAELEQGRGEQLALAQLVHLKILAEQGLAAPFPNGFALAAEDAVRLEPDLRRLFRLPGPWPGSMELKTEGTTPSAAFRLVWELRWADGAKAGDYRLDGPLLHLGGEDCYLPDGAQWQALRAVAEHRAMADGDRCEYRNLLAIHHIQQAREAGLEADLRHFDTIQTLVPERVTAAVTVETDGDLRIDPNLGAGLAPDAVAARLGQIAPKGDGAQSLRVGDKIVLLDPERLAKVREIIRHRHIPKARAEQFFQTPSAFLDAELVDMDQGYSLRVKGMTEFRHAYFGETEATEIDWLNQGDKGSASPLVPADLGDVIKDLDDLERFRDRLEDARRTGSELMEFHDLPVDIGDREATDQALADLKDRLQRQRQDDLEQGPQAPETPPETSQVVVVDTLLNDEELEVGSPATPRPAPYGGHLDWDGYRRRPFPHQEEGIRWLLGLARDAIMADSKDSNAGALLADDMGLGKTFMALAAVREFYRLGAQAGRVAGPVLVVAPLSLLEGWRQEVGDSFAASPFKDIVTLHGDVDLKRYRLQGKGIETVDQDLSAAGGQARVSLKVGAEFGDQRLDRPGRLVLVNYTTLANYQFSLCRVDWSFVILDEAQNTKNPNTLQTRAAKALKAQFRLMVTGTPVENSLTDFWSVMDTARPGLLDSYQAFRKDFVLPILRAGDDLHRVRVEVGRSLRQRVNGFMLRRMKEDRLQGLPTKTIYAGITGGGGREHYQETLACSMSGHQQEVYDAVVQATMDQLEQEEGGGNPVLAGLSRLRDVSLHPDLLDRAQLRLPNSAKGCREECRRSGKLQALLTILEQVRERGEKALIFVINKRLQAFLSHALSCMYEVPVEVVNGDTKAVEKQGRGTRTRRRIIEAFEQAPGFGLLVMSPVAAGVGLTITAANHVIHLERHWNPAKEDQATDRVYRIGQKRDVHVYLPILLHPSRDSFDLNLHRLLTRKVDLKDAIITSQDTRPEELAATGLFGGGAGLSRSRIVPKELKGMRWELFEALVAELLEREYGGEAQLTKDSHDKGCDVVLRSPKGNWLAQCKATGKKKLRGDGFVREIHGAKPHYEQALKTEFPRLAVFTNARTYDKAGESQARTYGVDLHGFAWLEKALKRHRVERSTLLGRLDRSRLQA